MGRHQVQQEEELVVWANLITLMHLLVWVGLLKPDLGRRVVVSAKYRISQICSSVHAEASGGQEWDVEDGEGKCTETHPGEDGSAYSILLCRPYFR